MEMDSELEGVPLQKLKKWEDFNAQTADVSGSGRGGRSYKQGYLGQSAIKPENNNAFGEQSEQGKQELRCFTKTGKNPLVSRSSGEQTASMAWIFCHETGSDSGEGGFHEESGNAIVAPLAETFIRSYCDIHG